MFNHKRKIFTPKESSTPYQLMDDNEESEKSSPKKKSSKKTTVSEAELAILEKMDFMAEVGKRVNRKW